MARDNIIKVLIADDNEITRDGTARLLEYEEGIEIVGYAGDGQEAIQQARQLKPHVILMDINMPRMDGLTATERIRQEMPAVQVVVVSVQDDTTYMDEAFNRGAFDFVAKPISARDLLRTIVRAKQQHDIVMQTMKQQAPGPGVIGEGRGPTVLRPTVQGQIITVLGMKGGVGKTTIAVNLGVGLARSAPDKRTIVLDSNVLLGDVGIFLNARGQHTIIDLANLADEPDFIDQDTVDSIAISHESGVKLLVAPPPTEAGGEVTPERLHNMLNILKGMYDYVVVDTTTTLDPITSLAIQIADRLVVVTEPTMPAIKNTRVLFTELQNIEIPMERITLVLNRVDSSSRITAEQIGRFLGHEVNAQIPTDPFAVVAVNNSVPLINQDAKRASSVRPLINLVQLVRGTADQPVAAQAPVSPPQPQRRGLTGRLFGG